MTKQTATFAQKLAIHETLKETLVMIGEGQCRYYEGHTDSTVAADHDVSPNSVAYIRKEIFGKLVAPGSGSSNVNREYELRFNMLIDVLVGRGLPITEVQHLKFNRENTTHDT